MRNLAIQTIESIRNLLDHHRTAAFGLRNTLAKFEQHTLMTLADLLGIASLQGRAGPKGASLHGNHVRFKLAFQI
jgi:hypothetical protein